MNRIIAAVVVGCVLALITAPAIAEPWPNRPIKLIVPFPPGGPTDMTARVFADHVANQIGQPVVIENRPGANSTIGAQVVARSAPDGYTLLFAMDVTMVMNPITRANLPYNALDDFDLISLAAFNTSLVVVPANGPKTVDELIAQGRANPGKLNYGAGIITTQLAGYLFNKLAGIRAVYIPYKGSVEVVQGLLNGSIQYSVDGVSAHFPLIESGRERALAKLNNRPLETLPDLKPLWQVANMPALGEISTWSGVVGPRGIPLDIVDKLQRAIVSAAADPRVKDKLRPVGVVPTSSTPAEFRAYVKAETAKWSAVVKENDLKFDD